MYIPAHFAEDRPEELHRIMRAHPLGLLCTAGPDGLDANHLPFHLDPATGPHGTLLAHVARANPLWQGLQGGAIDARVMVVFRAEHAYVSPNGYPSKALHHKAVPTWNYRVVHAHGVVSVREDEKFLRALVGKLTRAHEASEAKPWTMAQAPRDYMDDMLGKIVGLEIAITRLDGKFKLSQNRDEADRLGAADHLAQRGDTALADWMRKP